MRRAPAGATEWSSRDFRSPGRGSDSISTTNRWFAPPANVQCPFGTSRSLSSSNSRYAMRSRRFEVEDFAKQIRGCVFDGTESRALAGASHSEAATVMPLKICDLTQFYSPLSGGVKRYVHEKLHWIQTASLNDEHILVIP